MSKTLTTPNANDNAFEGSKRRGFFLARVLTGLLLLGAALPALAANTLKNISVSALPGDQVQVVLEMSGQAVKPVSFTIDNPARIALDLPNTRNGLKKRSRTINIGMARSITAIGVRGRTRVILNLAQMVPYKTRVSGNRIYLTLANAPGLAVSTSNATTVRTGSAGGSRNRIEDIDFRRAPGGTGRVIIKLSNPSATVDMRAQGGKIVVDLLNSSVPGKLERRLDVTDFATPVKTIDTFAHGGGTRMVITPTGLFDHLAYQTGNTYTIEIKPTTKKQQEAERKKKFGYSGRRLSLNFQNIEVRAVLQLLADFTGLNVVVSDSVKGNLTLRLKNVPWDQALDIILKTKGLAMRRTGNVILVAPSEELAAREKLELEAKKQIRELAPLRTEWFQINYANAADLLKLFEDKKASLLSPRGKAVIDKRTNTIMIQDTQDRLDAIRRLIARLDIPVRQVLIESRIVIATNNFTKALGVKFGLSKNTSFNTNHTAILGGKVEGDTTYTGGTTAFDTNGKENLITDLGITEEGTTRLGLAIGRIGNHLLQLELSALQAEGRGEIISSPRVITANQKTAVIKQGVEIPYQQAASSGATTVAFKEAVLSLQVTPLITPDNRVLLDLKINNDTADFNRSVAGVPPINTREVQTQVLVNNGETVVLGGVYERTKTYRSVRTPFFSDLPIVGFLFRNKRNQDDKSELLIFVTPKIIKQKLSTIGR